MEEKYKKYSVTIKSGGFTEGKIVEGESPFWAGVNACKESQAFNNLKDKWDAGYEVVLKDSTIEDSSPVQFYWKLFVDSTENNWVRVDVIIEEEI